MTFKKISYPATALATPPESRGRNGWFKTSGVEVGLLSDKVHLTPYTSKGTLSESCVIALPADKQVLLDMAAALEAIANTL